MRQFYKKNFHFIVAILVFFEMIVFGGLINSASVFIIPISDALHINRGTYAAATIPYTLVCCAGTMVSGYLFQHFGYKRSALVSLLLVAISLVMTAFSNSLLMFTLSKVVFGLGYGACFTAGAVRIVKDWFWKHQGLVLGAVSMSSGLGGSLMTYLLSGITESYNWRIANLVAAGLVVIIALSYFIISDRPEQKGLQPYGYGTAPKKKKAHASSYDWPGYSLQELLKHPVFYVMIFCVLASCVCIYMTSNVAVAHFRSIGFDANQAASYQSTCMLVLAGAKLVCGGLCDRFGPKPISVLSMLCAITGQGLLGLTADPILCYLGMALYAIGMCMTSILIPLLASPLFGYKACLSVNGIFLAMSSLASIFSNPLSNACYDRYQSYQPGFLAAAAVNVGILGLYLVLFGMARRERTRFLAAEKSDDSARP